MSTIKDSISQDLKKAMKAGDNMCRDTLRMLLSEVKSAEISLRADDQAKPLDDNNILQIINKMIKQRRESIEQFLKAERHELAEKEQQELSVLQKYLPEQLDPAKVATIVESAIAEAAATGMQDMGKVMAILKPKLLGKADMKQVSSLVRKEISADLTSDNNMRSVSRHMLSPAFIAFFKS